MGWVCGLDNYFAPMAACIKQFMPIY